VVRSRQITEAAMTAPGTQLKRGPWTTLLGNDPREWLLACDEPAARWVTLAELLDRRRDDPELIAW
jgi:hypothetical protein